MAGVIWNVWIDGDKHNTPGKRLRPQPACQTRPKHHSVWRKLAASAWWMIAAMVYRVHELSPKHLRQSRQTKIVRNSFSRSFTLHEKTTRKEILRATLAASPPSFGDLKSTRRMSDYCQGLADINTLNACPFNPATAASQHVHWNTYIFDLPWVILYARQHWMHVSFVPTLVGMVVTGEFLFCFWHWKGRTNKAFGCSYTSVHALRWRASKSVIVCGIRCLCVWLTHFRCSWSNTSTYSTYWAKCTLWEQLVQRSDAIQSSNLQLTFNNGLFALLPAAEWPMTAAHGGTQR